MAGRGRGRGLTLPAWLTAEPDLTEKMGGVESKETNEEQPSEAENKEDTLERDEEFKNYQFVEGNESLNSSEGPTESSANENIDQNSIVSSNGSI